MKNKKGFTLIELLAVIVILAIITAVVSSTLIKTKKRSNIENVKTYESTLENLGMQIYVYDRDSIKSKCKEISCNENNPVRIDVENLQTNDYLEELSNPNGDTCMGYLAIYYKDDDKTEPVFKGNICCPTLYKTGVGEYQGSCNLIDYEGNLELSE